MINVILCGGSGTRLWPLSRKKYPKQFVPLLGKGSLFQETVSRNSDCDRFIVVTSSDYYYLADEQLSSMKIESSKISFLLEPSGRNTAPAIALAAMMCDPSEVLLVTPSDHLIGDVSEYGKCMERAVNLATGFDKLVTFGIKPYYPEIGYGYIEKDEELADGCFAVRSFREKPDPETAKQYISSGNFSWNSGMFVFKAGVYLDELKKHSFGILKSSEDAISEASIAGNITRIEPQKMLEIPSESIDYAVMEKSDKVAAVQSDFGWSDLGSFDSIYEVSEKDENGSSVSGNYMQLDSRNNLIMAGERKVVTIGIEDSFVIDSADAILIGKRGESQKVKEIADLISAGREYERKLMINHLTVFQPWGTSAVLSKKTNYEVKELIVKQGCGISQRKHELTNEQWVVVKGTALFELENGTLAVNMNESVFVAAGKSYRFANSGNEELIIIGTFTDEYDGQKDITGLINEADEF